MKHYRVLLIGDHLLERINLMKVLTALGVRVDTATHFEAARGLATQNSYDLVISAILLNQVDPISGDGLQFWESIKKFQPDAKLVLMAAPTLAELTRDLMESAVCPPLLSTPVCRDAANSLFTTLLRFEKETA